MVGFVHGSCSSEASRGCSGVEKHVYLGLCLFLTGSATQVRPMPVSVSVYTGHTLQCTLCAHCDRTSVAPVYLYTGLLNLGREIPPPPSIVCMDLVVATFKLAGRRPVFAARDSLVACFPCSHSDTVFKEIVEAECRSWKLSVTQCSIGSCLHSMT